MLKKCIINGIICEFNPFHNGHGYILRKIKEENDGYVVCVMSGNFVQRGECSIIEKRERTQIALKNGADLVLELPLPFAISSAETFARGGVEILNALGSVDNLYFGSECGNVKLLDKIAKYLSSEKFSNSLKNEMSKGVTFASGRENCVAKDLGESYAELISQSNNILGIEYIKALNFTESTIKPMTITRHMVGHDKGYNENFASASEIRRRIYSNEEYLDFIPSVLENKNFANIKNMERSILYKLRNMSLYELKKLPDISEGLENKIFKSALSATSLDELYDLIKTKRYTHARIRRIVLAALLSVEEHHSDVVPYIRILGANGRGMEIIGNKSNLLPIIGNYGDAKKFGVEELFELEAKADDIYALMTDKILPGGSYYTNKIIKL